MTLLRVKPLELLIPSIVLFECCGLVCPVPALGNKLPVVAVSASTLVDSNSKGIIPVSYTHLTLPTILLV